MRIAAFSGQYRFLSNFWPSLVEWDGQTYPTVEHAYQAAKTDDMASRRAIQQTSTPGGAKRLGRQVKIRATWEQERIGVMRRLIAEKFPPEGELAQRLLATGDAELIEGNTWGDRFWGQCPVGVGENWLGRLLMERREDLKDAD